MSAMDRDLMVRVQRFRDYVGWLSLMAMMVVFAVSMWHVLLPSSLHWASPEANLVLCGMNIGMAMAFFATRVLVFVDREHEFP